MRIRGKFTYDELRRQLASIVCMALMMLMAAIPAFASTKDYPKSPEIVLGYNSIADWAAKAGSVPEKDRND